MFQPRVKLEFINRYCPPSKGWEVFVDIDASEEGRTGGTRKKPEAIQRQDEMKDDVFLVKQKFKELGVTVGGSRSNWYSTNQFPKLEGDRDIVAFNSKNKSCIIAEVEGSSSGQPETKVYKAIGQIVIALNKCNLKDWEQNFILVVHGEKVETHLKEACALEKLGIAAISLYKDRNSDKWLFGKDLVADKLIS
ncbi:hypothetical protein Mzhil_1434 [Methanosalsum zhilinae DSM 4017]|uniref:Uncharacterized protein n=1 Tax=Methanosalsum zhilinae (strain DSM 4017 / NBRC 107636 / OCM 62 / WeN5) TaxID=679901 RepID=F7XNS7_METZD|nr:hypothetical protein [Methanosalsum zhilinae]AEH61278.1 hypothetical protein Mzhil_1434 [Methanosalsum zhilinae DSM 4017]